MILGVETLSDCPIKMKEVPEMIMYKVTIIAS